LAAQKSSGGRGSLCRSAILGNTVERTVEKGKAEKYKYLMAKTERNRHRECGQKNI